MEGIQARETSQNNAYVSYPFIFMASLIPSQINAI